MSLFHAPTPREKRSRQGFLAAAFVLGLPALSFAEEPTPSPDHPACQACAESVTEPAVTADPSVPGTAPPGEAESGQPLDAQSASNDDSLEALSAELDAADAANPDPFERVNRHIFTLNRGVDWILFDPLTRVYRFVLGDFARQSIRNLFANLNTPVVLVNDLLQLQGKDAAVTTARFVVNSTMGMAGLFDPASTFGLAPHVSGFGETLESAGLGSGPYLVLPLLGPTTVRDGFGNLVDAAMAPQTYILPVVGTVLLTGSSGVVEREKHFEGLQALREQSVDFYASLRSAYFESRR